jgi:hypothetical protein
MSIEASKPPKVKVILLGRFDDVIDVPPGTNRHEVRL